MGNRRSTSCVDDSRPFIDAQDYRKTNIYKSKVLYHHEKEVASYDSVYLTDYTQNSKTINDALKDVVYTKKGKKKKTKKSAVRELDKCVIGLNHDDIYQLFQDVWKRDNSHLRIPMQAYRITVFRGARLASLDLDFLKSCLKEGKLVRNRYFLSCSMVYSIAKVYQSMPGRAGEKVLFVIYLHSDDRRSYAYVRSLSMFPDEEEVIIRPCRRFRVSHINYDAPSDTTTISLMSAPSYATPLRSRY